VNTWQIYEDVAEGKASAYVAKPLLDFAELVYDNQTTVHREFKQFESHRPDSVDYLEVVLSSDVP
jgi:hypothetical protein